MLKPLWDDVENDMEKRGVELFQLSWSLLHRDTRKLDVGFFLARVLHALFGELMQQSAERENWFWIDSDMCHFVIGCSDFYLILSLNSIILLQINFLFF
jgi:hypothetical protein